MSDVGYFVQLTQVIDDQSQGMLQVSTNFPVGAEVSAMNAELDRLKLVVDRQWVLSTGLRNAHKVLYECEDALLRAEAKLKQAESDLAREMADGPPEAPTTQRAVDVRQHRQEVDHYEARIAELRGTIESATVELELRRRQVARANEDIADMKSRV